MAESRFRVGGVYKVQWVLGEYITETKQIIIKACHTAQKQHEEPTHMTPNSNLEVLRVRKQNRAGVHSCVYPDLSLPEPDAVLENTFQSLWHVCRVQSEAACQCTK